MPRRSIHNRFKRPIRRRKAGWLPFDCSPDPAVNWNTDDSRLSSCIASGAISSTSISEDVDAGGVIRYWVLACRNLTSVPCSLTGDSGSRVSSVSFSANLSDSKTRSASRVLPSDRTGCRKWAPCQVDMIRIRQTYLLVDQILILAFDPQSKLHVFESCSFLKDSTVHGHDFSFHHFTFIRQKNQLPTIFEFTTQLLEGFCNLVVPSPGLPGLAGLTSSETDKGIRIVGLLVCLKLEAGVQWLVPGFLPSRLPVLVHRLGMLENVC
ncbi:hypothetical protein HG531_004359 [Fusarium graminearum]|nr:hypothetical protein HG531_004359 [Fusarium graminearum]